MAGNLRRRPREISRAGFYSSEDPVFTISGILSRRPAREDVSEPFSRIRTSTARRSLGGGGGVRKEIVAREGSSEKISLPRNRWHCDGFGGSRIARARV